MSYSLLHTLFDRLNIFILNVLFKKVQKGLHEFLFKLLILRYLMDSEGKMWRCNTRQLYAMEILEPTVKSTRNATREVSSIKHFPQDPIT